MLGMVVVVEVETNVDFLHEAHVTSKLLKVGQNPHQDLHSMCEALPYL